MFLVIFLNIKADTMEREQTPQKGRSRMQSGGGTATTSRRAPRERTGKNTRTILRPQAAATSPGRSGEKSTRTLYEPNQDTQRYPQLQVNTKTIQIPNTSKSPPNAVASSLNLRSAKVINQQLQVIIAKRFISMKKCMKN